MGLVRTKAIRLAMYAGLGLVLLLALFAFVSRDNLFRYLNDPHVPFQTYVPPAAPDYAQKSAWAMAPIAGGNAKTPQIFVVTPTIYWGGKDWNTPLDAKAPVRRLWRTAMPNWAGPFRDLGALAIPLYRSASLDAFLTTRGDARGARALAYGDVLRAFDAFVAKIPPDAPIILAGVGQGGLHVLGLLHDRFLDPWMRERLAVAYVIDFAVPLDLFAGPLRGLDICRSASDSRCLVTYGAFEARDKAEIKRFKTRTMVWDAAGKLRLTRDRPLACVNPLLGAASTQRAPKTMHRGGVNASGLEWSARPVPLAGQTSAQCADGILRIDRPRSSALRRKPGFGNHFKPATFNLFYADIAHDAGQRIKNWRQRLAREGKLAPPLGAPVEIRDSPVRKPGEGQ